VKRVFLLPGNFFREGKRSLVLSLSAKCHLQSIIAGKIVKAAVKGTYDSCRIGIWYLQWQCNYFLSFFL